MIWAEDTQIAVDGEYLPGLFKSIEITGDALIEEQEIEGSSQKKKQAQGYEDAKVTIELILEDGNVETKEDKLQEVQNLFRKAGQDKPAVHTVISGHLAARGVSKVLLKSLTSREESTKSRIIVTLTLMEYNPMTVTAAKTTASAASSAAAKKTPAKAAAASKPRTSESYQRGTAPKLTKASKQSKSPAADTKETRNDIFKARKMLKAGR